MNGEWMVHGWWTIIPIKPPLSNHIRVHTNGLAWHVVLRQGTRA